MSIQKLFITGAFVIAVMPSLLSSTPASARTDTSRCSAQEEFDFSRNQCVPNGKVGNGVIFYFDGQHQHYGMHHWHHHRWHHRYW